MNKELKYANNVRLMKASQVDARNVAVLCFLKQDLMMLVAH
jgi:hypothetical protein